MGHRGVWMWAIAIKACHPLAQKIKLSTAAFGNCYQKFRGISGMFLSNAFQRSPNSPLDNLVVMKFGRELVTWVGGWLCGVEDLMSVRSNLARCKLYCPWERHFTAIYLLGCSLVAKMYCASIDNSEAGTDTKTFQYNRQKVFPSPDGKNIKLSDIKRNADGISTN